MRDDPEFIAWLEKSCADQNVPLKVTDPTVLRKVATLLNSGPATSTTKKTRSSGTTRQPPG